MTTPTAKLFLALFLSMGTLCLHAQPPIQFSNSKEAIRQYEESTIETLRERCKPQQSADLALREELVGIRDGFIAIRPEKNQSGHYEVFAFDSDKRSFFLIDGQTLLGNTPLKIKLSLPRDYARCRLVQNPQQADLLEVVHIERNYQGDAQKMRALIQRANDLRTAATNPSGRAACERFPIESPARSEDKIIANGSVITPNACDPALRDTHERMAKLVRKVFER